MATEYCMILKTLKAGPTIYEKGTVVNFPYPEDIQTEIDNESSTVEVRIMDTVEEEIIDKAMNKKPITRPIKKRAKK